MLRSHGDAAHDLHGVIGHFEGGVGAVVLAHGGSGRVEVAVVVVCVPGGLVQHVLHVRQLDAHIGDLDLVELEAADGLPEGDAAVRVRHSILEGADGGAVVAGAHEPALEVEVGHAAHEAVALFAEDVLLLKLHVVHVDLAAAVHAQAQLGQRGQLHARLGHIEEELGEHGRVVGVLRHDDEVLHTGRGGDEGLGAVEVDLAVLALVGGGQRAHVGTGARLGAGRVPDLLAGAQRAHDGLDLLFGALADDGLEAGQLVQHVGGGAVLAQDLVHGHQRHAGLLQAQAAVALGEHDLVEAQLAEALHPAQRVLVLLVALVEVSLPILALHVLAVAIDDKLLLVRQLEIHDDPPFSVCATGLIPRCSLDWSSGRGAYSPSCSR